MLIEFIAFIELKENKTKSLLHTKWKGPYVCVIFHIIFFSIIIISISFPCHIVQTRPDQYLRHRNISYFFCFLNTQHLWWCVLQNHFPKIVWIFYRLKFNHYFVKTLFTFWQGTQISFDSLEPLYHFNYSNHTVQSAISFTKITYHTAKIFHEILTMILLLIVMINYIFSDKSRW